MIWNMSWKLPPELISSLYEAILAPVRSRPSSMSKTIWAEIAREGWAQSWLMEDLILATDPRLQSVDIEDLGRALERYPVSTCQAPNKSTHGVSLITAWAAIDAASLLIFLHEFGFEVDPSPLVALLKPTIPKKGYISEAALDLLWFDKRRGKLRTSVRADDAVGQPIRSFADHDLATGHKVTANLGDDGRPLELTVTGPKFRRRPEPRKMICVDCGVEWYRGDPDSSASHRREHKKRMRALDPQPLPQMLEHMAAADHEHVTWLSPEWAQEEVHRRAVAFKREFGYDFVQWSKNERDPRAQALLFTLPDGRIAGACAFRWREYEEAPHGYGLQWIWIAPRFRRLGILRSRWCQLRARFGEFVIEGPVSNAMHAFATAMGDGHLIDGPPARRS